MSLKVVILAAGKGTRMRSQLPKVLQPLAQQPLLQHVVNTASTLDAQQIVTVIGHGAETVQQTIKGEHLEFALQTEQLGTGHAVAQANDFYGENDTVLILYGDVPLTAQSTLKDLLSLVDAHHPLALLTIRLADSSGYGRIVRNQHHQVQAIVEEKDATAEQKSILEVNTGIMAVKGAYLKSWLGKLSSDNAQGELYLTDIIEMCVADGFEIHTTQPGSEIEVLGVNDKKQLQDLERRYQRQQAELLMRSGVTLMDADRVDVRGHIEVGQDVTIDVNVIFEGQVKLGNNVQIGANCIIKESVIADNTIIHAFSHIEDSQIEQACVIGPYARLRPGTELASEAKIGNFVEIKKSKIGFGSKVNHLSYIGDTLMGAHCNIGAGTITCNYDGVNKHLTEIGEGVFVGSDSQLVAPVKLGDGATIGAGSTITKEVPAEELTLSRSKQITLKGWKKPVKKPK
ncbi:MAG: bifunctional UDP-N-acetylglucosamine diphosphorylase/glucosamine-1-phosphate N-acetyltransferase GlmU [Thiomicrorhabdus chilensis]|uniref:bifunctional UDP-N-acetylglucosamine diphosphorylase/glucosamine-1-phosphate N-acetyltransferase GlmU n=1 Tax=Thiomicrorhabdus chilensis TaxID=63656 RepID=UPI00299DDD62|nr:bifunctional UDP-N-acetylglucosamine diphosphorylase/glucosamine-1-phosphate N-acetyltransferase GlmU [Thiomicrorhabdus chilensis]MDX1348489.1 bifunctional UDP-N-acetylglucosamine diphosphorylase/glucosamine-1-phosphate N-acetyltransferase GlmU [Thiomicrorhabdus chilensis]